MEQDIELLQTELEEAKDEIEELKGQIKSTEESYLKHKDELNEDLQQERSRIKMLVESNENNRKTLKNLSEENEKLTLKTAKMQEETKAKGDVLNCLLEEHRKEVEKIQQEMDEWKELVALKDLNISGLWKDIENLRNLSDEHKKNDEDYHFLEEEKMKLEDQLKELVDVKEECRSLEAVISKLRTSQMELETSNTNLKDCLESASRANNEIVTQLQEDLRCKTVSSCNLVFLFIYIY